MPGGKTLEKPGNFFFLTETSLWGTEKGFVAKGVETDLNDDGKVEFGEALPDAAFIKAVADAMDDKAKALDADAKAWTPTREDVFNAVVVMTPTMSEYFEAWKNSRFVAGDDADETGFVGAARRPVRAVRRAGADRVPRRDRGRARDGAVRDAGGAGLPRRRGGRVRGHRRGPSTTTRPTST